MSTLATQLQPALASAYALDREIGRGGMATVYLARDIRHNRRVAVKVLDPELGAVLGVDRFLAEIQVTANLQHPNLLPLFDSGQAAGLLYYVMPYVEGESLRARLAREKQLPIDEAVHIAVAVASALDYAHRHGVIHRDLKPENILLHEQQPLVADFGIALAVSNAGGSRVTQTGISLGTPQYMSPEQATGDRAVDGRSDIYSLGAVTYEMLTGEPPHTGNTAQAVIARVITDRPRSIRLSRETVPAHVERAVDCALAKLPADRFSSARDFAEALAGKRTAVADARSATTSSAVERSASRGRWTTRALVGALVLTSMVAAWALLSKRQEGDLDTIRFSLPLRPSEHVGITAGFPIAVAPDGRAVAYLVARGIAGTRLVTRRLHDIETRDLPGTDGADQPVFSPDGKWIAFVAGGFIKKVPVDGSASPMPIINATSVRGLAWTSTGEIIVARNGTALMAVPDGGGDPRELTKVNFARGDIDHRWPTVLADGKTIVFVLFRGANVLSELGAVGLEGGPVHRLGAGIYPLGLIQGRLAYVNSAGTLMTVAYDPRGPRLVGRPMPHFSDVSLNNATWAAYAALSRRGDIVYHAGARKSHMVISDLNGNDRPVSSAVEAHVFPRFSPDGQRIAVGITSGSGTDVWIFDRRAGTIAKLTTNGQSDRPEWTPDGRRVLYRARQGIFWQASDYSRSEEMVARFPGLIILEAAPPTNDGRYLLFRASGRGLVQDIAYMRIGDTTFVPITRTPTGEYGPRLSPDGKWIAYTSDASGTPQVYIMPFPGPGPRHQLSANGGAEAVWGPDGRRVFYVAGRTIMSVRFTLTPAFSVVSRDSLFTGNYFFSLNRPNFDVAPNGREIVLLKSPIDQPPPTFVRNWGAELRRELAANP